MVVPTYTPTTMHDESSIYLLNILAKFWHCLGFLFLANLVGVKWNPIVVWIYIFLMTNEAERLFMGLSGHSVSFFGNSANSFASSNVTDPVI